MLIRILKPYAVQLLVFWRFTDHRITEFCVFSFTPMLVDSLDTIINFPYYICIKISVQAIIAVSLLLVSFVDFSKHSPDCDGVHRGS